MRLRRAVRFTVATLTGVAFVRAAQAAWSEYRSAAPRRSAVPMDALERSAGFRDVEILGKGGTRVRGWWTPGTNGAAVVLVHGSNGDRRSALVEARAFVRAGYGVLVYDHPGHGESEGRARWTHDIPEALVTVLSWVRSRPEVSAETVFVVGFSMGCATTVEVVSRDTGVAAVALLGAFTDAHSQTMAEYDAWGPIQQIPALLVLRASGIGRRDLRPIDLVGALAPRPLLLVAGTEDHVVPAAMTRALFAAAGAPKELWLIPGAGHGGYESVVPDEYPARLVAFFDGVRLRDDR